MNARRGMALFIAALSAACGGPGRRPATVVYVDTIVVNSKLSIAMPPGLRPSRLLGPARWRAAPAGIAHVTHPGAVACDTSGDATVTASTWFAQRTALLLCRPVTAFGFVHVRLPRNGMPFKVQVPNRGLDGRPVTQLAGTARVRDTSVAVIRDGLLYPRALGQTWVNMDFAGMHAAMSVEVIDTVTAGTVTLAPGEIRSWMLPHGRYEIYVAPRAASGVESVAVMIVNANCADGETGTQHYYCVTYETGALAIRNRMPPGSRNERAASVVILRQGW